MTVSKITQPPAYRDATQPIEKRVADLLGRMLVDEKIAQLGSKWVFELTSEGKFAQKRARSLLKHGLGQVTRVSGASNLGGEEAALLANAIQRHLVEETRLGIPAIVHEEICSGLMARDATVFPQPIGVASTWEPKLAEALGNTTRVQMRSRGAHQGLGPVLDVCRDPRWGRTEETLGEDPHLVAEVGCAFIRGLQGADLREGVVATVKHFVGYSASDGGMNWAPAQLAPREALEVYFHPFEAAVRACHVRSLMHAYVELDGIPCAANSELLESKLREDWGFDGVVVSDYFGVRQIVDYHQFATDGKDAAAKALNAGVDTELPSSDCYGTPLLEAIAAGAISEEVLDTAVRRILRLKFELGLFENPFVDASAAGRAARDPARVALAREVAHKSIVLLRNDGTLPLGQGLGSIALIGPNAAEARHLFGDYTYPAHIESLQEARDINKNVFSIPLEAAFDAAALGVSTILDALRDRFGERVRFAQGCDVSSPSREGFEEAAALAARSDVAVLVMGDKSGLTDDCTSGESRDRVSLDLPGVQEELVRLVVATGTPVVLVLVSGRPTGSTWIHDHSAAVLTAWLPGEEGGNAVADVLTGEVNPGGKLPLSYPRLVGQIPVFYNHKASGGRSHWKGDYVDSSALPLYPFGHGLSYTTFALRDAAVRASDLAAGEPITVDVTLTNSGGRRGDEVVQLYIRDPQASVTRPVLELKGFSRVELAPGESRRLTFQVPLGQVGFYDRALSYVVEPGSIEVFVGTSSVDLIRAGSIVVPVDVPGWDRQKAFSGSVTVRS